MDDRVIVWLCDLFPGMCQVLGLVSGSGGREREGAGRRRRRGKVRRGGERRGEEKKTFQWGGKADLKAREKTEGDGGTKVQANHCRVE